jgi:citrate synthase
MDIKKLINGLENAYYIDKELYDKYNVKRGLRNKDGSGVLVGLTRIGNVHGYYKYEQEVVPDEGRLHYRGIDVAEIVENISHENRRGFEEVAYLLIFGKFPNQSELNEFNKMLDKNRSLPDGFTENMVLKSPSNNIMNKLARSILALYSYDQNAEDINIENVVRQSIELIARFPTMLAYAYQAKAHYFDNQSLFIHTPKKGLSTADNFLRLIRSDKKYTELEAQTLDMSLILHAEHSGGNNSAFTTHVVTSSDTDTYSAIAAAVGSLKGPKHGGANLRVMQMIENIKTNVSNWEDENELSDYIVKILRKEANDKSGLVYGIGHAVYTKSDPRAVVLKKYAESLAKEKGAEKEYRLYESIERLTPKLFREIKKSNKVLCANVDFYSGFVYDILNIPTDLFTPIFAMARITGWCAHRIEELISGGRIIRPAYKNVENSGHYIQMDDRG